MDIPTTISIIVGTLSIAIACFAMVQAQSAARESRANYDKTKDVLGQIDKKAEVIEKVVADNQRELFDTVKNWPYQKSRTRGKRSEWNYSRP